jgi:hypothetical protein
MEMGVPNVHYLPMAAIDLDYDTTPLTADEAKIAVSFVGNQNTSYFSSGGSIPAGHLWHGVLAHAVRKGMGDMSFWDAHQALYAMGEAFSERDTVAASARKAEIYFARKLFYNAFLCVQQRDRFVLFLKKRMGEAFTLIGERWDKAYGLACLRPLPSVDAYLQHFRETAVNINLVNGNSDSGLNMRHFEITAAGGFLLCNHQSEIDSFFEVGRECETFRTEEELLEKIHYYLTNPDERVAIALAGQKRTLREHLYSHRLARIKQVFGESAVVGGHTSGGQGSASGRMVEPVGGVS